MGDGKVSYTTNATINSTSAGTVTITATSNANASTHCGNYNSDLTFSALREANTKRIPLFKNAKGEQAHSENDGSDWSLAEWCNAVTGELGEAANLIKKVRRGDFTLDEVREELAKEFADVVVYLDILAMRAGVDLGKATVSKFNEVSTRVGCNVFLDGNKVLIGKNPEVKKIPMPVIPGVVRTYSRTNDK